MTIEFSEKLDWESSKPYLNNTYIDIHINPFNGEYDHDTLRNMALTWTVVDFYDKFLLINLKF
jgi:hypothetical protein